MIESLIKWYIQNKMQDVVEQKLWDAAGGIGDLILGGLTKNARSESWAQGLLDTLDRHDESHIWEVSEKESGKILGHVFGGDLEGIISKAATSFGLDSSSTKDLFIKMAPVVLGMLGKEKKEQGLNLDMFTNLLGNESKRVQEDSSPINSLLSGLIDQDNDGSIADDLFSIGKKFLG